jgi:hypothetical protein
MLVQRSTFKLWLLRQTNSLGKLITSFSGLGDPSLDVVSALGRDVLWAALAPRVQHAT